MTMTPSLLPSVYREPLQAAALVDNAFEDPPHRGGVQGPGDLPGDPLQDLGLPLRGVDRQPQGGLQAADLHRARRAAVEQTHELVVDGVDAAAPLLDLLHARPRSHATWAPRSASGCSSSRRTR